MRKCVLLLIQLLLSACSTIKYLPEIESVQLDSNLTPILNSGEKYSITSLFEERKNEQSEIVIKKPIDISELTCLAETMYFEARGESNEGMLAVGHVVLNRVSDERFPKTICGVVKQGIHVKGHPIKYRCQFTWYCDGLPDNIVDQDSYLKAIELALKILNGESDNPISNSLFYHAVYVRPRWSKVFLIIRKINKHIFYTYRDLVIAYK